MQRNEQTEQPNALEKEYYNYKKYKYAFLWTERKCCAHVEMYVDNCLYYL